MGGWGDIRDEDETFDHYARLVRRLLHVPVGLVSIVEPERQIFPGASGLPDEQMLARETPLSHSFCQYVVKDEQPLIVADVREHPLLASNPAIEELDVVAYAGWPLTDETGRAVGSLCAIDTVVHEWTAEDVETLDDLAYACSVELAERGRRAEYARALVEARTLSERSGVLLALSTALAATETLRDVAAAVARVGTDQLGCVRAGMWLRPAERVLGTPTGRARVSAPAEAAGSRGEELTFLEDAESSWRSATTFARLPLDESNPLGAALVARAPMFFGSRGEANVEYPHLENPHQLGEARAFVPLRASGLCYGTLALMWPTRRAFSVEDRVTITALASYTAQALHRALLFQERVDVALTLQNAMLTDLPRPAHLDLAARYLPAAARERIGGDWYDAVTMPDGATHLMVGDAMGHDIEAAAAMGQLRSMLRMASWMSGGPPSQDLTGLDRAMRDLDIDTYATVVLARIEPPGTGDESRHLRWSSAGHLPPLLVAPDGTATYLEGEEAPDLLLGVDAEIARHDHAATLEPGATVLLYTDGLLERRGDPIDVGLERLRTAAGTAGGATADDFLAHVLDALSHGDPEDDVALLAVRIGSHTTCE